MPSGSVHNTATITIGIITTPIMVWKFGLDFGVAYGAGVALGTLLTPDLDQSERVMIKPQHIVVDIFGHTVGKAWHLYWYPYGALMPHRSFFSHFPIVGTSIRVLYLLMTFWGICWILGFGIIVPPIPYEVFIGLCVADAGHYILDILPFFRDN